MDQIKHRRPMDRHSVGIILIHPNTESFLGHAQQKWGFGELKFAKHHTEFMPHEVIHFIITSHVSKLHRFSFAFPKT
jgi:hypothetical protein